MEEWRDIEGFEDLYQVSSIGRVRSKERYVNHSRNSSMKMMRKPKQISLVDHGDGYIFVSLRKDGKQYNKYVHRLVAAAFIPNPMSLPEVDHINRKRNDNRVENLRWVTRKDNIENSNVHGKHPNHWLKPSSGERYIQFKNGKWIVQIHRRDLKAFKIFNSKLEAIAYRDSLDKEVV